MDKQTNPLSTHSLAADFDVFWTGAILPDCSDSIRAMDEPATMSSFTESDALVVIEHLHDKAVAERSREAKVFLYQCRGPIKKWPVPAFLLKDAKSQAGSARIRDGWQIAGAFIDDPQFRCMPIRQRPQAKQLNELLREGDHVIIALSEFSGAIETGEVIGGWKKRGVHFHISDLPEACDDDKILLYHIICRLVRTEELWPSGCETERGWLEEGEGEEWQV